MEVQVAEPTTPALLPMAQTAPIAIANQSSARSSMGRSTSGSSVDAPEGTASSSDVGSPVASAATGATPYMRHISSEDTSSDTDDRRGDRTHSSAANAAASASSPLSTSTPLQSPSSASSAALSSPVPVVTSDPVDFNEKIVKEGYLKKYTTKVQGWKRRYYTLRGSTLFVSQAQSEAVYDRVELIANVSVAESSSKNKGHSFKIITETRKITLLAESRKEMEDWIRALKGARITAYSIVGAQDHNWYLATYKRLTFCNVCGDAIHGVTKQGLSCEVCKFSVHSRCAAAAPVQCKWTTAFSMNSSAPSSDSLTMPHQWIMGNLPGSSRCAVCEKGCGSSKRLADYRCLWCQQTVHSGCLSTAVVECTLGRHRTSMLPPNAITLTTTADGEKQWKAVKPPGSCPLAVFVNTKSGGNQGVRVMRRFKRLLNPAQIFDLGKGGPIPGLMFFRQLDTFRVLICGGDGSIGWVLAEMDKLNIRVQVGVLPIGTGNDLARVLGWGASLDDDSDLANLIDEYERSHVTMLDRWSIQVKKKRTRKSLTRKRSSKKKRPDAREVLELGGASGAVGSHSERERSDSPDSSSGPFASSSAEALAASDNEARAADLEYQVAQAAAGSAAVSIEHVATVVKDASEIRVVGSGTSGLEESDTDGLSDGAQPATPPTVDDDLSRLQKTIAVALSNLLIPGDESSVVSATDELRRAINVLLGRALSLGTRTSDDDDDDENASGERLPAGSDSEDEDDDELPLMCTQLNDMVTELLSKVNSNGESVALSSASSQPSQASSSASAAASASSASSSSSTATAGSSSAADDVQRPSSPVDSSNAALLSARSIKKLVEEITLRIRQTETAQSALRQALRKGARRGTIQRIKAAFKPKTIQRSRSQRDLQEVAVMNNYFGIGLDAKIGLAFHNKREEHPEKFRSRIKNMMWYGVLSGMEFVHQSCRDLHTKLELECDGKVITLPKLQGIVVLNIPSYMGGTNFWGIKMEDAFSPPACDDRILEVVAVFGMTQMAASKVFPVIRPYRIAQCRSIKISFKSDEPIPIQVDGEAWLQAPGVIKITHKTRTQMLSRDKAFLNMLRSWEEKQAVKTQLRRQKHSNPDISAAIMTADERSLLMPLAHATLALIAQLRAASGEAAAIEQTVLPLAIAVEAAYERLTGSGAAAAASSSSIGSASATVGTSSPLPQPPAAVAALSAPTLSSSVATVMGKSPTLTRTTAAAAAAAASTAASASPVTASSSPVMTSPLGLQPQQQAFLRRYMMDFTKHAKTLLQEVRWMFDMGAGATIQEASRDALLAALKTTEVEMKRVMDMQSVASPLTSPDSASAADVSPSGSLLALNLSSSSPAASGSTPRSPLQRSNSDEASVLNARAHILGEPIVDSSSGQVGNTSPKTKRSSFAGIRKRKVSKSLDTGESLTPALATSATSTESGSVPAGGAPAPVVVVSPSMPEAERQENAAAVAAAPPTSTLPASALLSASASDVSSSSAAAAGSVPVKSSGSLPGSPSSPRALGFAVLQSRTESEIRMHRALTTDQQDPRAWSTETIGSWLHALELDEYIPAFAGNAITGVELLLLNREDLAELGVEKLGHIKRLLKGIQDLALVSAMQTVV
ncbi:diacylglycerol kinase kappa [Capsaspora owczarzaki ATCC 30864]|uniref:Diacylglycerol kinase n=1 Tax=Capsaspora owczarzaki (strain ATCC 30864) TaxID=595528 RepID=A0A0D2WHU5_CAPO3|nr:diacylglycerol kinase kappa [Capsaspora owczarzaki ATCC 30864]KJE88393.1 diacylglycerol kinase kappa [Capsaspora owczarzaki ATCC 30864]|eukprot:XP_004364925.2 diacylglycerol kinase kappa [Capsaspora owczarzaki ATCC 30864]